MGRTGFTGSGMIWRNRIFEDNQMIDIQRKDLRRIVARASCVMHNFVSYRLT